MSWTCMQSFSFIPLKISEQKICECFFENLPFMLPWHPIKISDLDKIHMNRRGLLKKHFCKKKSKYLQWDSKNCHIPLSHYKSMETISCHINQSSFFIYLFIYLFVYFLFYVFFFLIQTDNIVYYTNNLLACTHPGNGQPARRRCTIENQLDLPRRTSWHV